MSATGIGKFRSAAGNQLFWVTKPLRGGTNDKDWWWIHRNAFRPAIVFHFSFFDFRQNSKWDAGRWPLSSAKVSIKMRAPLATIMELHWISRLPSQGEKEAPTWNPNPNPKSGTEYASRGIHRMSREIGYQIRENKAGTQKMIYHYKRGAERKNCWTYKLDCQRGSEKLATQGKVKRVM